MDTLETMLARRSIRHYTEEDVAVELEEQLIDAAFAAPSANNSRPWHFVVVRDRGTRARLAGIHRWSRMLARSPLVIAVLGRSDADWWIEDCSAATENILLAATELGLGSVWVGVRDPAPEPGPEESACLEVLGAPPGYRALCLVGIGHPAETKPPRTQRQPSRLSYERFAHHTR
jgi:nitroreductase